MIQDLILGIRDSLRMTPLLRKAAERWRNVAPEEVALDEYSWVDRERLEFYQLEFAALGFEWLGDFSLGREFNGVTGFMRLMSHASAKAHVSLHSTKPAQAAPQPLRCAINCSLSEDWFVAATDREADPILQQLRLPRLVALRDCSAAPAVLWRETQGIRDRLMTELNLSCIGGVTTADFMDLTTRLCRERAELILNQNVLRFAVRRRILMRYPPPGRELWTGEWEPQTPSSNW